MHQIKIKPKQIFFDPNAPKADTLLIHVNRVELFRKASVLVDFRNENVGSLYLDNVIIENPDYNQWNEDTFLVNYILQKYNCEREENE